jgi:hypothetical protein
MSKLTQNPQRIHLRGTGKHDEGVAAAQILPGDLIEKISTGSYRRSDVIGEKIECCFAIEDALQGRGIDTAYSAGEQIQLVIAARGDIIYANLSAAENVVIGDKLSSQGDGTLKKAASTDYVVAQAEEAVNASSSVDVRIRVRIL